MATDLKRARAGTLPAPKLTPAQLGDPYVDWSDPARPTVKARGSTTVLGYGSCHASVTFQLESRFCGGWFNWCNFPGKGWESRGEKPRKLVWQYAGGKMIAEEASMPCRKGSHWYRFAMIKSWTEANNGLKDVSYKSGWTPTYTGNVLLSC